MSSIRSFFVVPCCLLLAAWGATSTPVAPSAPAIKSAAIKALAPGDVVHVLTISFYQAGDEIVVANDQGPDSFPVGDCSGPAPNDDELFTTSDRSAHIVALRGGTASPTAEKIVGFFTATPPPGTRLSVVGTFFPRCLGTWFITKTIVQ